MPTRRPTSPPLATRAPHGTLQEGLAHALVGYQLAQAAYVTDRVFDEQAAGSGLRRVEFTLLALAQANPGVTARQLAQALAVTPPHVAQSVERLHERGLIARERSEHDGRVQHLRCTAEGEHLVVGLARRLRDGELAALATLSKAERELLVELLHKLARSRRRAHR